VGSLSRGLTSEVELAAGGLWVVLGRTTSKTRLGPWALFCVNKGVFSIDGLGKAAVSKRASIRFIMSQ
jgi:hypothetical protein